MDHKKILDDAITAEKNNRFQDGIEILRKGLRQFPGNPDLVFELARLHERLKMWPQAQSIYSKLVEPGGKMKGPVAIGLAHCMLGQSKFEEARKILAPLLQAAPKNIDVLVSLARCAEHRKDNNDAQKLLDRAKAISAEDKSVLHQQARIHVANKAYNEAVTLLEANIDRDDPYGDSIDLWLETLKTQKRDLYLREKLQEYVKKHPKRPEFLFGLGLTYSRAGEVDNARETLTKVNKMLPNNHRVIYEIGVLERLAGNIEKSQEHFSKVLELKPNHPAALRTFGVDHKYEYGDKYFTTLNTEASNLTTMQPMEQVQFHFALGKAFDDVKELPTAFRHYAIGGGKKRKLDTYSEQSSARMFDLMKKIVTKESIDKSNQTGSQDETPVFILGMPRSGTSLMEQILSSHPDIYGGGELKYMTSSLENMDVAGRRLKFGDVEAAFTYDENASWAQRGDWYAGMLKSLTKDKPKRIVDKMPGNFNFVGLIHAILPKARIIHSRRHPVETCLSCYRILFAEGHQWTYNLSELGRYYRRYWDLMQHWREQFPDAMYEARYEDNVADVEGSARRLIDYLGLEWNDNCLNFYNLDRPVKTASASQVRKPIYTTSVNRWRKYESYLGPLLEEIGDIVESYEKEIAHLTLPQQKAA
ncbi:MAG TPA: sulfotransferase [Ramlibacter sp.]|nr:sulfotransferase [Ramlibacter sp.]